MGSSSLSTASYFNLFRFPTIFRFISLAHRCTFSFAFKNTAHLLRISQDVVYPVASFFRLKHMLLVVISFVGTDIHVLRILPVS